MGGCYVDEAGKVHIIFQRGRTWWLLPRNDNCIPLEVRDDSLSYGTRKGDLKDDILVWTDTQQAKLPSKDDEKNSWRRIDMSCQQASFFAPPRVPVTYLFFLFLIVGIRRAASFGYVSLCRMGTFVSRL